MVEKIISRGKKILILPQTSIFSAASVIMAMILLSRLLGLVRQRILAYYFAPSELALFFAAFRLPDLLFEVLVYGTFSSAFIPVFTKTLKKGEDQAWRVAATVLNVGVSVFILFAIVIGMGAERIYSFVAPGFTNEETAKIASLARILFAAQGFFIISYVLTAVLESLRRFLVPALAPIFYNLGIILGTVLFYPFFGLTAPVIGVVLGAFAHFLIQLPLARKLGFRFINNFDINDDVKKIGKLALPRVFDLSVEQIQKTVELYLASIISTASYTYFTFANSLQLLPVSFLGTSIAKAALPILSRQEDDWEKFKKTLLNALHMIIFLATPLATMLLVLRIPLVRLVFGTSIFDWEATVQTGKVLSAFALGIVFQIIVTILSRSFYALHDTKTPVTISFLGMFLVISGDLLLVSYLKMPIWSLAASFSFSMAIEALLLAIILHKRRGGIFTRELIKRISKVVGASFIAGSVMYFLLKFFDKSVWVKKLSFLSSLESAQAIPFEKFVIDTRYSFNLLVLTLVVTLVGTLVYLGVSLLVKSEDLSFLASLLGRYINKQKPLKIVAEEPIPPEGLT